MAKKYLMGLDLGTDSVGWCVTDENNKIIKKGGKSLWGARLFDEAQDCKSRRTNREARRRTQRRRERIDLLQLLFKEEIDKVDKNFFLRLNESFYKPEDKSEEIRNDNNYLFPNERGNDDFKYETIYHLRKTLCDTEDKADIRLIYLAVAHMIKYRGNFLYDVNEFKPSDINKLNELLSQLNETISEIPEELELQCSELNLDVLKTTDFFKTISDATGITKKKEKLAELFGKSKYNVNVVYPLIAGGKVGVSKIFPEYEEKISPESLDFSSSNADECIENLSELFPDDVRLKLIQVAREIYDYILVGKLLGESKTISEAMVSSFNKHKGQLDDLKDYVRKNIPDKYDEIFRKPGDKKKLNNYVMYVGKSSSIGSGRIRCGHCDRDGFYSYIKETLGINKVKKAEDIENDHLRKIYIAIENKDYLPRQNSTDNSVFPYQLNKVELLKILRTQSKYYPFLLQKDKDGISTIEKIEKILTFKIPYYVGPLFENKNNENNQRSMYSWMKRNPEYQNEKIYPWNFEKVVNVDESASNFIHRMLNKCTYLPDQYCLPLNSLLFQRYQVLSMLNKTAINGKLMPREMKENLIENVFKKRKKVSKNDISKYFQANYSESVSITTSNGKELEEEIPSMSSYYIFSNILGRNFVDNNQDVVEKIIQDLTVFEDKKIIERRLRNEYKIKDTKLINQIKELKMTGWASLSRKLLELKTSCPNEYGEIIQKKLIDVMDETNFNLMELINDNNYNFKKEIEEAQPNISFDANNAKEKHDAMVKYVDDCFVSPGMKRPLIQAMGIIEDVKKIIGHPIDEYYVECTRSNKKSERTDSRKKKLLSLYAEAKKLATSAINDKFERKQLVERIDSFSKFIDGEKDIGKFRSDKLYLYLSQLGKCMYSLEDIDLTELMNGSGKYDIDHIIPQSLVKDDSIDNRVLVKSERNKSKKDNFPIPRETLAPGAFQFFKKLFELKLISKKKYENLTRTQELSNDEKLGFVNRQLVYTNQAVKALVNVIQTFEVDEKGNKPRVIYSKAENVSNFRRDFDVIKVRDANHFHHAHDAYLNICIGRAVNLYFGGIRQKMIENKLPDGVTLNVKRLFENNKTKDRKPLLDNDESIVWDYQNSIEEIRHNVLERHDILTTTMQYIKLGQLTESTICPATSSKGGNLVPVKKNGPLSNTAKYGGKSGVSYGFYTLIERVDGKKTVISLIAIPLLIAQTPDANKISKYIKEDLGYSLTRILIPCVRKNAKLVSGSSSARISAYNGDRRYSLSNNSEPFFNKEQLAVLKKVSKVKDIYSKYNDDARKTINELESTQIGQYSVYKHCVILNPATSSQPNAIVLTSEELLTMYDCMLEKYKSPCVDLMSGFTNIANFLENNETRMKFTNLDVVGQSFIISQLLGLFTSSLARANLSLIDGGKSVGASLTSQNLDPEMSIIVESPTGYYTKTLWKGQQ